MQDRRSDQARGDYKNRYSGNDFESGKRNKDPRDNNPGYNSRKDNNPGYNSRKDNNSGYNTRKEYYSRGSDKRDEQRAYGAADFDENRIEGRNAVIEAYRAGRTIEKLFLLEGPAEGAMQTVLSLAKENSTPVRFCSRQRLDQLSQTGKHQGVIAQAAAFRYAKIEDLFAKAAEKGEDPFFVLLDRIEDPHNLGAIIRTANLAGAHGVIIPRDRAVGLTATAIKASAGAIHYTPVVKVTNLVRTMEELKKRGLWFACADMGGTSMTKLSLTGPIGLVIGAEGTGVSRLVREKCDMIASIPMKGEIDSLNASVAAGILMYEILRQRG